MTNNASMTMKDIARELGISVATVSRALSGSQRISGAVRERVLDYARRHDFTPNMFAETLRYSRVKPAKIIGVIVPEFAHFYFSSVLAGIEERASESGYRIMVAQSGEDTRREAQICRSLYENKVCGVIVSQAKTTTSPEHFLALISAGVPIVFYDRISTSVPASRVVVDDYTGAFGAVCHLLDTGCRRIAFYGSPMTLEISKNRFNGYKDALHKYGAEVNPDNIIQCDCREDAERLTPEILSRPDDTRPDAFFAVNDDTAIGIMYTAKRMGLRVPEDISVCGFTNGQRAVACDPPLTTVEQRGRDVGREAAGIIIDKMEYRTERDEQVKKVIRTRLIVRQSTR